MQLLTICLPIITLVLVVGAALQAAQAQSTRTYVSRTGKDGNTCAEASPCRTLQAALAKTQAGGQIYTLGSADYGAVTINKAVSIISGRGETGVLATSNVTGITINAGASDIINLQGLNIDGAGAGTNGILFTSGAALSVKDSVVRGFSTAINFQPSGASTLSVTSTLLTNNTTGVSFLSTSASTGTLAEVQLINSSIGLIAQGASSSGQAVVTLQNCVVANNTTVGIRAAAYSSITATNCTVANNGIGLEAQSSTALLQVSGSTVTGNGIGWQVSNGGQVISASNNSIGGNTSGNEPPPTSIATSPTEPPPPPPEPTVVAKNIITDFGARCDGIANDNDAFTAFNAWARSQTLPITLTIPTGSVCTFNTPASAGNWFAKGIKKLLVIGYGATLSDNNGLGNGFFLGGAGVYNDNLHSSRVATVEAGARTVRLLAPAQSSLFTVGGWALMTGYDLQGAWKKPYGYPPNPHFFEYVHISSINPTTGEVTFLSPLKNTYRSTWPNYNSGNASEVDSGGPATLYALDSSWDTEVEYRGLTISGAYQTGAVGRSVTFRDVTFTGQACSIPSQNILWQAIDTNMSDCAMEADKLIETMNLAGVTIRSMFFQSSSIDQLTMTNSNVTTGMNGTPKRAFISDTTIADFRLGAYAYGRTDEVVCTNCILTSISGLGVTEKGLNDQGVNVSYTMNGGIIAVPNTLGAVRWAVPGTNLMWRGRFGNERSFRVVDVTQDAENTYVHTTLEGGFPSVPSANQKLFIGVHPAPKFTCKNCTGSMDAEDLSRAPAGAPIYSYSRRTYTGTNQMAPFSIWGTVVGVKLHVTKPYTGNLATLKLEFVSAALRADDSLVFYDSFINLKIPGERIVTPFGVLGAQSGDTGLSLPSPQTWLAHLGAQALTSEIGLESPEVWPTITVEIITDQGVSYVSSSE